MDEERLRRGVRCSYKSACKSKIFETLKSHKNQWVGVDTLVDVLRDENFDVSCELVEECVSELLDQEHCVWESREEDGGSEMLIGYIGDR